MPDPLDLERLVAAQAPALSKGRRVFWRRLGNGFGL
jgi:hypothetical protein